MAEWVFLLKKKIREKEKFGEHFYSRHQFCEENLCNTLHLEAHVLLSMYSQAYIPYKNVYVDVDPDYKRFFSLLFT